MQKCFCTGRTKAQPCHAHTPSSPLTLPSLGGLGCGLCGPLSDPPCTSTPEILAGILAELSVPASIAPALLVGEEASLKDKVSLKDPNEL